MTTTHDDNATTWRELADQLTPEQIAELEYCEREGIPPGLADPEHQLNGARAMAKHNLIQALCADIPAPPDAGARVHEWEEWGNDYGRMYGISMRDLADMSIQVLGVQHDDGHIERFIMGQPNGDETMTAPQAREIAASWRAVGARSSSCTARGPRNASCRSATHWLSRSAPELPATHPALRQTGGSFPPGPAVI
jgi:hypothetical protein